MSARLRRPSMNNLDVIQEVSLFYLWRIVMWCAQEFRGSFRKKEIKLTDSAEKREITTIVIEDILELNSSSFDPRFSPWNLFSFNGGNSSISGSFWVSTGLIPQYIAFELKMNWDIREVRVICSNVERVSFTVEGAVNRIVMHKVNRYNSLLSLLLFLILCSQHLLLLWFKNSAWDFSIAARVRR